MAEQLFPLGTIRRHRRQANLITDANVTASYPDSVERTQQAYVIRNALGVNPTMSRRLCHGAEFQPILDVATKIDPAVLNALPEKPRHLGLPFSGS